MIVDELLLAGALVDSDDDVGDVGDIADAFSTPSTSPSSLSLNDL